MNREHQDVQQEAPNHKYFHDLLILWSSVITLHANYMHWDFLVYEIPLSVPGSSHIFRVNYVLENLKYNIIRIMREKKLMRRDARWDYYTMIHKFVYVVKQWQSFQNLENTNLLIIIKYLWVFSHDITE